MIIESNNKDPAFLANPLTPMPKDRGFDFFACPFKILFPNLRQPLLSMKNSEKDALESKIKDIAHTAILSNFLPEDTKLGTFPSQSHDFLPILNSAPKALALTILPASLLKLEALEPDSSI